VSKPLPEGLDSAALAAKRLKGFAAQDYKGRRTCYSDMVVDIAEISGQQGVYPNLLQLNEALYDTLHAAFCVSGLDEPQITNLAIIKLGKIEVWSGTFRQWSNTLVLNLRLNNKQLRLWNQFYHLFYQTGLSFLWSKYKVKERNGLVYFE